MWQYYIWLLVVLRLLIPISPDISIVGSVFRQAGIHFTAEYLPEENITDSGHLMFQKIPFGAGLQNDVLYKVPTTVVAFSFLKAHFMGILWLFISIILLFRKIYGYKQLVKTVEQQNEIVVDEQLLAVLEMVSTEMGIKKRIPVYTNSFLRAPILIGVFRPSIIIPSKWIPLSELKYIFRHELTHFRRRDFIYKWLVEITVCLHWFNPVIYWVRKQINRACELSCDEAVVACLGNAERKAYGDTLLNSIVLNYSGKKEFISLSLNEDGHLIKERLCAIMQYTSKSKRNALAAAVLTTILIFGTVFAGAYIVVSAEKVQSSTTVSPIRISKKEITTGGKITLGSQHIVSGTECRVFMSWEGADKLTIVCISSKGTENSYSFENGKVATFRIPISDEYTIAIKNNMDTKISNVNGTIEFLQSIESQQSVIYENVEMRYYEGKQGHPYLHDTITNGSKKAIVGYQFGMLAFDKDGNPLQIKWMSLDSEDKNTFFNLSETETQILPGETYDVPGGWSLNFYDNDSEVDKIAYVLYANKAIVFDDGSEWINPDFEKWRATYEGQKMKVDILENYYPYQQKINE